MKVTIDIDMTPDEARRFLGLPDTARLESFQDQMLNNAQEYLKEQGQTQMADLVTAAMQPMIVYQNWLQTLAGGGKTDDKKD